MNKDQLKKYVEDMRFEVKLQELIWGLIDNAKEVNQSLLNTIAEILNLQADFYEQNADLLDAEAEVYETLSEELNTIDEEERATKLEALVSHQKELIDSFDKKIAELNNRQGSQKISEPFNQVINLSQPQ